VPSADPRLPFSKTFHRQLLPVQLDFSDDENLDELQRCATS
jgi:hypothetical protein